MDTPLACTCAEAKGLIGVEVPPTLRLTEDLVVHLSPISRVLEALMLVAARPARLGPNGTRQAFGVRHGG